jgi:4-hydroxy-L-threonine phosphate dehydrogenase PdxA
MLVRVKIGNPEIMQAGIPLAIRCGDFAGMGPELCSTVVKMLQRASD